VRSANPAVFGKTTGVFFLFGPRGELFEFLYDLTYPIRTEFRLGMHH
jgi:hypothetical protein